MKKMFVPMVSLLFFSSLSFADQAIKVTEGQATAAKILVESASVVQDYCSLCVGDVPSVVFPETVEVKKSKTGDYELLINDVPVDLAYLYVDGQNLGLKLQIEDVKDVVEEIQVPDMANEPDLLN